MYKTIVYKKMGFTIIFVNYVMDHGFRPLVTVINDPYFLDRTPLTYLKLVLYADYYTLLYKLKDLRYYLSSCQATNKDSNFF
jgi:hypothetical protein